MSFWDLIKVQENTFNISVGKNQEMRDMYLVMRYSFFFFGFIEHTFGVWKKQVKILNDIPSIFFFK